MIELALLVLVLLGLGLFQLTSRWLARVSARCGPTAQATMPVGPFFVSVTTIFGLLLALHGNYLWNRYESELYAHKRLQLAVDSLERFAGSDRVAHAPALLEAVSHYAGLVRKAERPVPGRHTINAETDAGLQALEIAAALSAEGMPAPLYSGLARRISELASAHSAKRLREETARPNVMLWIGLIALAFLSNASIALVHQDRAAAGGRALLLFNLATGISFWLLLRYEFRAPLAAALDALISF